MSLSSARRRLRADRQALEHHLIETVVARAGLGRRLAAIKPGWFVGGGLIAGAVVGGLSTRAIGAAIGGLAAFSIRLMGTPLGTAAFGAIMARRSKEGGHGLPPAAVRPPDH